MWASAPTIRILGIVNDFTLMTVGAAIGRPPEWLRMQWIRTRNARPYKRIRTRNARPYKEPALWGHSHRSKQLAILNQIRYTAPIRCDS